MEEGKEVVGVYSIEPAFCIEINNKRVGEDKGG
jgi:hypothetical protein